MKTAWSPDYELHLPDHHRFPMIKYGLLPLKLMQEGMVKEEDFFSPETMPLENIFLAHHSDYVNRVLENGLTKNEIRRIGFPWSEAIVKRELKIIMGTYRAAKHAMKERNTTFNIAGGTHHAGISHGEGFCIFNDVAVAIRVLQKERPGTRFLVVDLDVHQGNGTAEIFKNDPLVITLSVHGKNNFPFRKTESDFDIGLNDGCGTEEFLVAVNQSFKWAETNGTYDMVFYNSGVDILESDALGRLMVSMEGCEMRDRIVFNWCKKKALPITTVMGGGYSHRLNDIIQAHITTFRVAHEIFNGLL